MTHYRETELDEHRYLHDAAYHANRELVRGLVEAEVLVPVKGQDAWLTVEDIGSGSATVVNWDEQPDYMSAEKVLIVVGEETP